VKDGGGEKLETPHVVTCRENEADAAGGVRVAVARAWKAVMDAFSGINRRLSVDNQAGGRQLIE